jgi:hypothetical protein
MALPNRMQGHRGQRYRHIPLNDETPSIRLVQVLPRYSTDCMVQCKIIQRKLPSRIIDGAIADASSGDLCLESEQAEDLPYTCLSYTWGNPGNRIPIKVDGKSFYVSRNLHDFLVMARRTLADTWLWIDALCIDQSNTLERNHQVQQMGRIYSLAETVLIWLGDDKQAEKVLNMVNQASIISNPDAYKPQKNMRLCGMGDRCSTWSSRG